MDTNNENMKAAEQQIIRYNFIERILICIATIIGTDANDEYTNKLALWCLSRIVESTYKRLIKNYPNFENLSVALSSNKIIFYNET